MRHFLNTLFVTTENAYLTLEGENVVVNRDKEVMGASRCIPFRLSSAFRMQGHPLP